MSQREFTEKTLALSKANINLPKLIPLTPPILFSELNMTRHIKLIKQQIFIFKTWYN